MLHKGRKGQTLPNDFKRMAQPLLSHEPDTLAETIRTVRVPSAANTTPNGMETTRLQPGNEHVSVPEACPAAQSRRWTSAEPSLSVAPARNPSRPPNTHFRSHFSPFAAFSSQISPPRFRCSSMNELRCLVLQRRIELLMRPAYTISSADNV